MSAELKLPLEIEPLVRSLLAVHLLGNLPADEPPSEELIKLAYSFYSLLHHHRDRFALAASTYTHNFAPETLDDASVRALAHFPENWRYGSAIAMAVAHTEKGDLINALRYSEHLLTAERATASTESAAIADARKYDTLAHTDAARELCYFALLDDMRRLASGGLRILDIGCGSGLNSEFVVRFADHLIGLDLSEDALVQSGRRSRYDALLAGDARDTIAQLEGPFDLIICTGALYFFDDLDWLFKHARRLLSPHGQFVANAVQASNAADCRITRSGNHRHCHSLAYLERTASAQHMQLVDLLGSSAYALPCWLLRFYPTAD